MSLISIVKDFTLLRTLDQSTISTLQENVLILKKYSRKQLFDIIKQRVKYAIKPNVLSDKLIISIVNNCVELGDVRKAINITRNCVKIAESREKNKVTIEDIHDAIKNLIPSFCNDILNVLNIQQLLINNSPDLCFITTFQAFDHDWCVI